MNQEVLIRIAEPERDAQAMLEIYAYSIANSVATFELENPTLEDFQKRIRITLAHYPWLVAELNGQIVGYAYASQHRPRIGYRWTAEVSAYVSKTCVGRGVGSKLYRRLINVLKGQGLKNLLAIISIPNPASEALHQKMGFQKIGQFDAIGFKFDQWQQTCWWQSRIGELNDCPDEPIPFAKFRHSELCSELLK